MARRFASLRRLVAGAVGLALPVLASAALSYVGAGTLLNNTGNNTTALPAGYASGDLCLVWSTSRDAQTHSISSPSGWTQIAQVAQSSTNQTSLFYRVMTSGSETAPTVSRGTSTARIISRVVCYRGVDSTPYIAGSTQTNVTSASGTFPTATPAVTTTAANSYVLHFVGITNSTNATTAVSSPTGVNGTTYSPGFSAGGTSTTRTGLAIYSVLQASAGSSGTSNLTTTQADQVVSMHVVIDPNPNASASLASLSSTGALGAVSSSAGFVTLDPGSNNGLPSTASSSSNVSSLQVTGFNTGGASLLVLLYGGTTYITGVSDTAGKIWSQSAVGNHASIWTAPSSGALSNDTIIATFGGTGDGLITVMSLLGARSSPIGASNAVTGLTGASTITTNCQAALSLLLAVGYDTNANTARTMDSTSTKVTEFLSTQYDTYWVEKLTSPTSGAGNYTTGTTAPTTTASGMTSLEILSSSGTASLASLTATGALGALSANGGTTNGTANLAALSSTGGQGAVSASGNSSSSLASLTGVGAIGAVSSTGGATKSLASLAGTGAAGAISSASGTAVSSPASLTGAGALGSISGGGGAAVASITSAGALGTVSATGGASRNLASVTSSGGQGALNGGGGAALASLGSTGAPGAVASSSGSATSNAASMSATGALGALSASGSSSGTANLASLASSGAAGALSSTSGGAAGTLASLTGTGAAGALAAGGGATLASSTGTGAVKAASASGASATSIASLGGTGTLWPVSASGTGGSTANLASLASTGSQGAVSSSGTASRTIAGVSASGALGGLSATTAQDGTASLGQLVASGALQALSAVPSVVASLVSLAATGIVQGLTTGLQQGILLELRTVRPADGFATIRPADDLITSRPANDLTTIRPSVLLTR
jgi:hypothetical protein